MQMETSVKTRVAAIVLVLSFALSIAAPASPVVAEDKTPGPSPVVTQTARPLSPSPLVSPTVTQTLLIQPTVAPSPPLPTSPTVTQTLLIPPTLAPSPPRTGTPLATAVVATASPVITATRVATAASAASPAASPPAQSASAAGAVVRVDVGGPGYSDASTGREWLADRPYTPANASSPIGWGYYGPPSMQVIGVSRPIAGTTLGPVYQTQRLRMTGYRFDLPNDQYRVIVRLAELYTHINPGANPFDIVAQGQTIFANVDIIKNAGRYKAYDRVFTTTIAGGALYLTFTPRNGWVAVAGIDVESVAALAAAVSPKPAASPSAAAALSPSATAIVPVSPTVAQTRPSSPTAAAVVTGTATAAATLLPSPTVTVAVSPTVSVAAATPSTPLPSPTTLPQATATTVGPTPVPTLISTPLPEPSPTTAPSPAAALTSVATGTPTSAPSETSTPTPTDTTTRTPSPLPTDTTTRTPSPMPADTPTAGPTATPRPVSTQPPAGMDRIQRGAFTVVFNNADRAVARDVLDASLIIEARVGQELGIRLGEVEVRLFSSRDEYNQALGVTAPADQVGNIVDANHIWLLAPNAANAGEQADILRGVQVELVRVALMQIPNLPLWVRDGVASYEARLWNDARQQYMRSLVLMRRIASLRGLDGATYNYLGGAVTAHTVIEYLVRTYGAPKLAAFLQGLRTVTMEQAMSASLGVTFSEFDRGWMAYVQATYGR